MESHTPQLVIVQGNDAGKVISLQGPKLVIGRTKGDVRIADPRMSRAHVELHWDSASGTLRFQDLKSLNGTLHNEQRAVEGVLVPGDKLRLGDTVLEVRLAVAAAPETRATPPPAETSTEVRRMTSEPVLVPLGGEDEEPAAPGPKGIGDVPTRPTGTGKRLFQSDLEERNDGEEKGAGSGLGALLARFWRRRTSPPAVAGETDSTELEAVLRRKTRRVWIYALLAILLVATYYANQRGGSSRSPLKGEADAIRQLLAEGKSDEALAAATALKDKNPESSEAWLVLGDVQLARGRSDLAIFSYEKAKAAQPPLGLTHVRLMRAYLRSQMLPQAEEEMRAIDALIKKGEMSPEFLEETAMILLDHKELKQPPEKIVVLARALQVEYAPNSTVGYRLESQVLLDSGRAQEALAVIEKGLKLDPADEWLLENATFARLSMKDIPGATKVVDSWIQKKPQTTKARLIMSYLLFNQQKATAAVPHLQKILEVAGDNNERNDPHYAEALDLIGQIHQQQNKPGEATALFERACQAGFAQSCERIRNPAGNPAGEPPVEPPREQ
jgi:tetratricopeptide (TPR) repeat protein/pSer/pThr/pTyr-binding forkhead associated (FHA) protein